MSWSEASDASGKGTELWLVKDDAVLGVWVEKGASGGEPSSGAGVVLVPAAAASRGPAASVTALRAVNVGCVAATATSLGSPLAVSGADIVNISLVAATASSLGVIAGVSAQGGAYDAEVAVGQNVQTVIDAQPVGAVIQLATGIHTGQAFQPKANQTIQGDVGAILDGTGNSSPFAIYGNASSVTIKNLEIRNYQTFLWGNDAVPHQGAIHPWSIGAGNNEIANSTGWRIENCTIHNNAGWGIRLGNNMTITGCTLRYNGIAGVGGGDSDGGIITDCDIHDNNDPSNSHGDYNWVTKTPYVQAWNAAGIKLAVTTNHTITGNRVYNNNGVGIWHDINCDNITISNNIIYDNYGNEPIGIFYEISEDATITGNTVTNHGPSGADYLTPAGIYVWSSNRVTVENNTVSGSQNAIVGNSRPRTEHSPPDRDMTDLLVQNNTIIDNGLPIRMGIATDQASNFKTVGANNSFPSNYLDGSESNFVGWWTDISQSESTVSLSYWESTLGFNIIPPPTGAPTINCVAATATSLGPALTVQADGGGSSPPPTWDASTNTITWSGSDVTGTWPTTSSGATAYAMSVSESSSSGNTWPATSAPAGFSEIADAAASGWRPRLTIWEDLSLTGSESGSVGPFDNVSSSGTGISLVVGIVSGGGASDVQGAFNDGHGQTATATGITTLVDNSLVVAVVAAHDEPSTGIATPAGWTKAVGMTGAQRHISVFYREYATAAATGDVNFTIGEDEHWRTVMFSIPPA